MKFFRNIRKNNLTKGKVVKYLFYAIGEIILVVIGILLALQINSWNEHRKSQIEKRQLIVAFIEDFESTKDILAELISATDSIVVQNKQLLIALQEKEVTISRNQIIKLAPSFSRGFNFSPKLPSYNAAKTNNKLKLFDNEQLMSLLSEYDGNFQVVNMHIKLSGSNFYGGSLYDLRKTVGSAKVLETKTNDSMRFHLSDQELIGFLTRVDSFAALETTQILNKNINSSLTALAIIVDEIIMELKKIQS